MARKPQPAQRRTLSRKSMRISQQGCRSLRMNDELKWREGLYFRSPWRRDREQPGRRLKAILIQQPSDRDGWHFHEALVAHDELNHVGAPAEPTCTGLQIRWVDKPGRGRRR